MHKFAFVIVTVVAVCLSVLVGAPITLISKHLLLLIQMPADLAFGIAVLVGGVGGAVAFVPAFGVTLAAAAIITEETL